MFEKAARKKLRFVTSVGMVTVEDLWDMPLTNTNGFSLDDVAISLRRDLKEREEESFVVKKTNANTTLKLKFDVVKHIIKVKLEEKEAKENQALVKAKKEKLREILVKKKDAELEGMSAEDIETMLEEL